MAMKWYESPWWERCIHVSPEYARREFEALSEEDRAWVVKCVDAAWKKDPEVRQSYGTRGDYLVRVIDKNFNELAIF